MNHLVQTSRYVFAMPVTAGIGRAIRIKDWV